MLSHCVIFWTKPEIPGAADALIAGAEQHLRPIPFIKAFHLGRMVRSDRPVVDQSYQVGLHLLFENKAAEESYQIHPWHLEFVEKVFKPNCARATIFDFA